MRIPELLIVADRGQLKAYSVETQMGRPATPRLVERFEIEEARQRIQDEVTDQAGAFPNNGSGGKGNSIAERPTLLNEQASRSVRKLTSHVEGVLRRRHPDGWGFAAPPEINGVIIKSLADELRRTLRKNVTKDLVNIPPQELAPHFS